MRFGLSVRALRTARGLTLRAIGERVGVSCDCISEVENGELDLGDAPGSGPIRRRATLIGDDEEMRLLTVEERPETIRRRHFERPDAFRRIARPGDETLDRELAAAGRDPDEVSARCGRSS